MEGEGEADHLTKSEAGESSCRGSGRNSKCAPCVGVGWSRYSRRPRLRFTRQPSRRNSTVIR